MGLAIYARIMLDIVNYTINSFASDFKLIKCSSVNSNLLMRKRVAIMLKIMLLPHNDCNLEL